MDSLTPLHKPIQLPHYHHIDELVVHRRHVINGKHHVLCRNARGVHLPSLHVQGQQLILYDDEQFGFAARPFKIEKDPAEVVDFLGYAVERVQYGFSVG